MPEETEVQKPSADSGAEVSSGVPSQTETPIDPVVYQNLLNYYNEVNPFVEKARPYYEDVTRYIEDEEARNLAKNAWKSYESIKTPAEQVPGWAQEIREETKRVSKYVQDMQYQNQTLQVGNRINSLAQSHPMLAQDDYKLVKELRGDYEAIAGPQATVEGFGQYVERMTKFLPEAQAAETQAPAPTKRTPPRSLRGDSSLPGVPDVSKPQFSQGKQGLVEMRNHIRESLRKAAGKDAGRAS